MTSPPQPDRDLSNAAYSRRILTDQDLWERYGRSVTAADPDDNRARNLRAFIRWYTGQASQHPARPRRHEPAVPGTPETHRRVIVDPELWAAFDTAVRGVPEANRSRVLRAWMRWHVGDSDRLPQRPAPRIGS